MTKLKEILKKNGGISLIKNYCRNHVLLTAICEFLLLGRDRTSLEILRLSVQQKVKIKLRKKYIKKLIRFDKNYIEQKKEFSNKIWICWFQGIENAPDIVKKCYNSVKNNLSNKEIILITEKNMSDYVSFPDYIMKKWKAGIITNTHMTDLLRLELLSKYGGMWLDATVFCSRKIEEIPEYYFNSNLFMYQCLKPGRDGHAIYISSWLISAKSNNKILMATQYLCYEYWKKNNKMIDYFLLHDFLSIVLEFYEEDWKKIIPVDNSTPHILLLRLFDKYDEDIWNSIKEKVPFHKLTYKFEKEKMKEEETFYKRLLK
ncbi:MAG: capsular polysaccharide synthesis protein [Clostridia bacterium]